jgi:hypothetical protein
MASLEASNGHLADLSPDEYRKVLEERVQYYLQMSLDEFLRRLEEDDLPDNAAVAHLKALVGAAA